MSNLKSKDSFEETNHSDNRVIVKAYGNRLASLKLGMAFYASNDIAKAVQSYERYLTILASYYQITKENLNPSCFNKEKNLSEMFLISHVYWDLAIAYDRHVNMMEKCVQCLDRFVIFTLNLKYHSTNFRMIRKYIRSGRICNKEKFNDAFNRLKINAKACYIADYCLGEIHPAVSVFRNFKKKMLLYRAGNHLVEWYYLLSPGVVSFARQYPLIGYFLKLGMRPFLLIFAKVLQRII